jgi:hypothetical protein
MSVFTPEAAIPPVHVFVVQPPIRAVPFTSNVAPGLVVPIPTLPAVVKTRFPLPDLNATPEYPDNMGISPEYL